MTHGKESAFSAGDSDAIPAWERSSGERKGNPFQYSCLENSTDKVSCGLQSMGSQRVGHDSATNTALCKVTRPEKVLVMNDRFKLDFNALGTIIKI